MTTPTTKTSPLEGGLRGASLLNAASACWQQLDTFRRERARNKDYTFGRQWNDLISVNGHRMTEREYIISEGNIPLQNNLIRRIVRNVLGVFRSRLKEKMQTWDADALLFSERNQLPELLARTFEEFLISGMAVCRRWSGKRNGIAGEWLDYVSPAAFFFDTGCADIRGWDVSMLGQIHDMRTPAGIRRIFEVWVADPWRFYFIDTEGNILRQGFSPYREGHPYIFKVYPFLDGEIHSFVHDIIDQQRYANRLITLYDWVMRASAKGVLMVPEGCVEPNSLQNVADQWSRFNGVIVYKAKAGEAEPHQVSANTANIGIGELLNIQLKMLEDVSGVTGALQGTVATNSMSGTLYSQQTQNSLTALSDILDTFLSFASQTLPQSPA